jgi:hypothetical protein
VPLLVVHLSKSHYTKNIVQQALRTFKIIQNLQDIIRRNIGMYFPSFLCEVRRGEEVVKAGGGFRCTTSNGTCSYSTVEKLGAPSSSAAPFPTLVPTFVSSSI